MQISLTNNDTKWVLLHT